MTFFGISSSTSNVLISPMQVFQLLELPAELEDKETNQALLLTERRLFLESLTNKTILVREDLLASLQEYEVACSQASEAGIDIVNKAVTRDKKCLNAPSAFFGPLEGYITNFVYLTVTDSPTLLTGILSSHVFSA